VQLHDFACLKRTVGLGPWFKDCASQSARVHPCSY